LSAKKRFRNKKRENYFARLRYRKNPQYFTDHAKKWRRKNPDKVRELSRRWRKNNPERYNAAARRRYLKRRKFLSIVLRFYFKYHPQVSGSRSIRQRPASIPRNPRAASKKGKC